MSANIMGEWKLREEMCEVGRRLYNKGFAAANDGNISMRLSEDRVLCTPTRVSKGFMKPDWLCVVDMDGKQVAGTKKRSSEILLHLAIMKARPDVRSCVHCHPPHATAFAVAHEPVPKCIMPEFEVFLGEVAITPYETPGTQDFADTVIPYVKDTDVILLANHGTITSGTDLMDAYFKTEIIDAYCRILLLTKQLGRVNYYSDDKAAELLKIKPNLGIRDPRLERGLENCDLCGNSLFREGYSEFRPEPYAFLPAKLMGRPAGVGGLDGHEVCDCGGSSDKGTCGCDIPKGLVREAATKAVASSPSTPARSIPDSAFEDLVQRITDEVMQAISGGGHGSAGSPARGPVPYAPSGNGHSRPADGSVVRGRTHASGVSGGV